MRESDIPTRDCCPWPRATVPLALRCRRYRGRRFAHPERLDTLHARSAPTASRWEMCSDRERPRLGVSKWITRRTAAHRNPLPLGELVHIGCAAEASAVSGLAHASHWNARMIGDGLIVHVNHARLQLARHSHAAFH